MGHLGILPQSVKGKFKSKGKTQREINQLIKDALELEKAGVFSIVLEGIEKKLSTTITKKLKIPTIGIGASVDCDGQGTFRLTLLPLAQRPGDILPLVAQMLVAHGQPDTPYNLSAEAQTLLVNYPWPGNVRELENVGPLPNRSRDALPFRLGE